MPGRAKNWAQFLNENRIRTVAEIGVYKGMFAEKMLRNCPDIETYYLLDPWRHLDNWNTPLNIHTDESFEECYAEALRRTAPWEAKRVILRGLTNEVIDRIPDASLDFAYIDGDHTLRGITIDLMHVWPKVRPGGFIGGDDFCTSVWQHEENFEPTFVFPLAVYFAEAMDVPITALPRNQFVIERSDEGFSFRNDTGNYASVTVSEALKRPTTPQPQPSAVQRLRRRIKQSVGA